MQARELREEIAKLPEYLKKEWGTLRQYYTRQTIEQQYGGFKKQWDNFEGETIDEFLKVNASVFEEWKSWKYKQGYDRSFATRYNTIRNCRCVCFMVDKAEESWCDHKLIVKSLKDVWNEFKVEWQLDTAESLAMFEELAKIKMSESMLNEFRMKYNHNYPHVYGEDIGQSKAELWKEFKIKWEIDVQDYNETKYDEMVEFVGKVECSESFFSYREDMNYHSFDSYSMLEQYEICQQYLDEEDQ